MVDENAEYAALTRAAIAASPDGTIGLVREQVPMLMPQAGEQTRDLFFELLVPQAGGYFLDPLDADDVTTLGVPAAYVPGSGQCGRRTRRPAGPGPGRPR